MGIFSRKKGDEWLDWLSDEQPDETVQSELKSKHRRQAPPQPVVIHPAASVNDQDRLERLRRAGVYSTGALPQKKALKTNGASISININVPHLSNLRRKIPRQQVQYWSAFTVAVIVAAVVLRAGLELAPRIITNGEKKDVQGTSTEARAVPSFKPLTPDKKPELGSNTSGKSQYDGKRDLFTFQDNFSGANILISQQPMPEQLKKDPAKVLQLTDSIGAKEKVTTAYGIAYFGVDEKSKVLRAVLLNKDQNRLVFLQSDKPFDAETIKFYFESLR